MTAPDGSATAILPHRIARLIAITAVLLSTVAIVSTYRVFSQTYDEPAHIASGMEWLERGQYRFEEQHPPLARIATALGPYLDGRRLGDESSMWRGGNAILYGGDYRRTLGLARLGTLPFFLLACAVVWVWTRSLAGEPAAALSVIFFTASPPVLAHASLATTDLAAASTIALALLAFDRWLATPTTRRSVELGGALALAVLCKFTSLVFLPVGALVLTIARVGRRQGQSGRRLGAESIPRGLGIALWVAAVAVWAAYRFSVRWLGDVPLPAPELVAGLYQLLEHSERGHPAFLLGEARTTGWWYFYPVVLAVKTPIPLLLFWIGGLAAAARSARRQARLAEWTPALCALAMLLVVLPSRIDSGVRYLLPMYPLMAVSAACLMNLVSRDRASRGWTLAAGAAVAWQVGDTVAAHPDHIAHFNRLGGSSPERIVATSDLDWGQDLLRLAEAVRSAGLSHVHVAYYGTADPAQHLGASYHPLGPGERVVGPVAVSERFLAGIVGEQLDVGYLWLRKYLPGKRIGKSIRLLEVTAPSS